MLNVTRWWLCAQEDVNVSLTAMGLLWNAADLLSKLQLQRQSASGGSEAPVLPSADFEELLRLLLGALQVSTPARLSF